jgi:hypothetical protein
VINNAGQSALALRLGGSYSFNNCTISNYWDKGFRQDPTLFISNTIPNTDLSEPLQQALFTNCIIYGDRDLELNLLPIEGKVFNYKFENTLLRFNDRFNDFSNDARYDFMNTALYNRVVINEEPLFENPDLNKVRVDNESAASGIANPSTASAFDILGTLRTTMPDAGAYESVDLSGS